MRLSDLEFEKVTSYDPFNDRAKAFGLVYEWVARDSNGNCVAIANTKAECIKEARRYIKRTKPL